MKLKSKKSALILSCASLIVCFAMLVGSTFAWFTDTATASVNTIQSGKLDVALEMKNASGAWVDAEGETLEFKKAAGAPTDEKILWEPGCTYELPELRVVNNGNLALKFSLSVNGVNGSSKLLEAIEWTMSAYDGMLSFPDLNSSVTKLLPGRSWEFKLSAHMKEEAGNEYQDLSIQSIGITVTATQDTVEYDSNDNQYDADAEYPNVVTLTQADIATTSFNKSNTTYYFSGNFDNLTVTRENSTSNVAFIAMSDATFNGDVLIQYHAGDRDTALAESSSLTIKGFKVNGNLTIGSRDKNVVIEGNTAKQIKLQMHDVASNMQVSKNVMNGSAKYGFWLDPFVTDYNLTVTGNTFENVVSHAIAVQGNAGTDAVTAAKTITVSGNTFESYGTNGETGRAAFKIWEDTKLAPNNTDPINAAAKALAESVKANNTFADDLADNCVVADFYGQTVAFN